LIKLYNSNFLWRSAKAVCAAMQMASKITKSEYDIFTVTNNDMIIMKRGAKVRVNINYDK